MVNVVCQFCGAKDSGPVNAPGGLIDRGWGRMDITKPFKLTVIWCKNHDFEKDIKPIFEQKLKELKH